MHHEHYVRFEDRESINHRETGVGKDFPVIGGFCEREVELTASANLFTATRIQARSAFLSCILFKCN